MIFCAISGCNLLYNQGYSSYLFRHRLHKIGTTQNKFIALDLCVPLAVILKCAHAPGDLMNFPATSFGRRPWSIPQGTPIQYWTCQTKNTRPPHILWLLSLPHTGIFSVLLITKRSLVNKLERLVSFPAAFYGQRRPIQEKKDPLKKGALSTNSLSHLEVFRESLAEAVIYLGSGKRNWKDLGPAL